MMNDFIRNPATTIKASHTIRELGYYINTIKIENLSLVCTLATRLSTLIILRFVSSLVLGAGLEPARAIAHKIFLPL